MRISKACYWFAMFTENEKQKFARQACTDFCSRTTILLAARGDLSDLGSAVLLRNDSGVPFLLTAKHVGEDGGWKPLRLLVPALDREILDAGTEKFVAPLPPGRVPEKPVDVAIVTLRADLHAELAPLAAGMEAIVPDDNIQADEAVIVAGFPTYLAFRSPEDARKYLFSTISHLTGVKGKDEHGRLMLEWTEAIPHEGAPPFPHVDVQPGKSMPLGSPLGISGGAVWRVRGAEKGEIWSPSSHAKLIGVPVSWNCRDTEYAESVNAWGTWVIGFARRPESVPDGNLAPPG
jgi:hypothetical protein